MSRRRTVVGLFAEGSRLTDPLRDDFSRLWRALAAHCERSIELKVFGIQKEQIVRLHRTKPGATELSKRSRTRATGAADPLDVLIERTRRRERLDRVIIAFDRKPPNQYLTEAEARIACHMRPEVSFVLRFLGESTVLDEAFRQSAATLLERYQASGEIQPRERSDGAVEILFMDPEFEHLLVSDEQTVRAGLAVQSRPKDWPSFKLKHRNERLKLVLDRAVDSVKGTQGGYSKAKSRWGRIFVEAATGDAALWDHPIASRLCRLLAA
ncbi:MAG: hypothetical protein ACYDCL_23750 [Myxococcales bacterium]